MAGLQEKLGPLQPHSERIPRVLRVTFTPILTETHGTCYDSEKSDKSQHRQETPPSRKKERLHGHTEAENPQMSR